jgi:hypothetical protein
MSGLKDFNYPVFDEAERMLQAVYPDWEIINPANNFDRDQTRSKTEYIGLGLQQVRTCDTIFLLPGWEDSEGACEEFDLAIELDLDVIILVDADNLIGEPDPDAQVQP